MDNNLIPANIVIADRQYRIKVAPKDEETVRHAVKVINNKIMEFKKNFPGKDMQDYVSMVLIWFATESKPAGIDSIQSNILLEKLSRIEGIIDAELG